MVSFARWLAYQESRRFKRLAKRSALRKAGLAARICDRRKNPLPSLSAKSGKERDWEDIEVDETDFSMLGWRWGRNGEERISALLNPTQQAPSTPTGFREPDHYFSNADIPMLWDCGEDASSVMAEVGSAMSDWDITGRKGYNSFPEL
jgi:hypothetical protein